MHDGLHLTIMVVALTRKSARKQSITCLNRFQMSTHILKMLNVKETTDFRSQFSLCPIHVVEEIDALPNKPIAILKYLQCKST